MCLVSIFLRDLTLVRCVFERGAGQMGKLGGGGGKADCFVHLNKRLNLVFKVSYVNQSVTQKCIIFGVTFFFIFFTLLY